MMRCLNQEFHRAEKIKAVFSWTWKRLIIRTDIAAAAVVADMVTIAEKATPEENHFAFLLTDRQGGPLLVGKTWNAWKL